jgi:polysaccharide biosynthesis protein PslG
MRAASVVRRRLIVGVVGVLALALLPAVAGQRGASVSGSVAGAVGNSGVVNAAVGSQQPSIAWEAPAQMNADLDAMVAAGMTWVRADFYWGSIELRRGQFSWSATDTFVRAAQARGLRVLAMPDYTPSWARSGPSDKYPPTNPSDYAAFVGALTQRYAPMGVHTWEIWNEPNNAMFWAPRADPVAYTRMLQLANAAIKHADPSATVVNGGLSPAADNGHDVAPLTFLTSIYAHGGRGSFDAVGYHPYSYPYAPMYPATWNTFYETPAVHALMAHYGDGAKHIWGTEIGFATGTGSKAVSAATQATDISAAIDQWTSWSFHGPIIFYTIRDLGTDRSDVNENMGMLDHSGSPKPVFAMVSSQLRAPVPTLPSIVGGVGSIAKPVKGTATLRIPVSLSARSAVAVSVHYMTVSIPPGLNARSGVDYVGKAGTLTFAPGQTRVFVSITVLAHNRRIKNDMFIVRFAQPSHATLGGYGFGLGVIR